MPNQFSPRPRSQPRDQHPHWRGTDASPKTGWTRAGRWFPVLGTCAECEDAPAVLRHHWDGNSLHNDPGNVVPLCKACHQRIHLALPPRPCTRCARVVSRLTRGLCDRCYWHYRRGKLTP